MYSHKKKELYEATMGTRKKEREEEHRKDTMKRKKESAELQLVSLTAPFGTFFHRLGNRGGLDATDPGGRLGPFVDQGAPDLRNFRSYFCFCEKGDTVC